MQRRPWQRHEIQRHTAFTETTNYVKRIVWPGPVHLRRRYRRFGPTNRRAEPETRHERRWHVNIEAVGLHYALPRLRHLPVHLVGRDATQPDRQTRRRAHGQRRPMERHRSPPRIQGWRSPKPGDVICFEPSVHGSSQYCGHVAVVEQVNSDGSILIENPADGGRHRDDQRVRPQGHGRRRLHSLGRKGNGRAQGTSSSSRPDRSRRSHGRREHRLHPHASVRLKIGTSSRHPTSRRRRQRHAGRKTPETIGGMREARPKAAAIHLQGRRPRPAHQTILRIRRAGPEHPHRPNRRPARRTGIRRHERRHLHDRDVQRLWTGLESPWTLTWRWTLGWG